VVVLDPQPAAKVSSAILLMTAILFTGWGLLVEDGGEEVAE